MNKYSNIVNEQTWQIPYKTQHSSTRHSTNVNNTGKIMRIFFPTSIFWGYFSQKCLIMGELFAHLGENLGKKRKFSHALSQ